MTREALVPLAVSGRLDRRRPTRWMALVHESGSSRPGESHPEALTEPCVNLSTHTALTIQSNHDLPIRRGSSLSVGHIAWLDGSSPSLHPHYQASTLLRDDPPLHRALVLASL